MARQPYYGIIGNGETCALISPKCSIEWLCLPRFDGKIVYGRALDPSRGEAIDFKIFEKGKELLIQETSQRYVSRTAVLETLLRFEGLSVEVTDFMPFNQDAIFRTNQRTIFRIMKIKNESQRKHSIDLKIYSGISLEKYRDVKEGIMYSDGILIAIVFYNHQKMDIQPGKEVIFSLAIAYGTNKREIEKEMRRLRTTDPQSELQSCIGFWINWFDRGKKIWFEDNDLVNTYYHSLMVIKLLIYQKTGAMIAAPTASFPATPWGIENWDYRFTWIRDSYFAIRALLRSGHYEEVEKMLSFFYGLQEKNGHWKSPLYKIDGKKPGREVIIDELTGPNEEDHVRVGNAASNQLQLDSEGSILHATYLYYLVTGNTDFLLKHWPKIKRTASWIVKNHDRKESGIWESRANIEHYTYGKVMCYVGLESASKIAGILNKRDEWKAIRERMRKYILKNTWSDQRQAFLQAFDDDSPIDISVLSLEDYGLVRPDDSKMKKTVRLIEQKLVKNNAVFRYENAAFPFYLPTLWLAAHYTRIGNNKRAEELVRSSIDSSTDLYLVAEHFDPEHSIQYGNFPQAFNAAMFVEQILNMKERRSMLNMLKIFELSRDDLVKLFAFDKRKIVEESKKLVGLE